MREGGKRYAEGDASMIRGMTPELASWFSYHAQTMDAALAQHMDSVGLTPSLVSSATHRRCRQR